MPTNRYYSLAQEGATASIDIYGDITSWPWLESDVSAYNLSQRLAELADVETINVNINSYGGEVAEGLAIYNALKRHSAKVVTRCDGFACSIASVIFSAGDERIMHDASLLMIHNAWVRAAGNAAELRKHAEDLDNITQASKNAYLANVNITEEELTALMDGESWISPQDALDMGFATSIETFDAENPSQNARTALFGLVMAANGSTAAEPVEPPLPSDDAEGRQDDEPPAIDVEDEQDPSPDGEGIESEEPKEEAAGMAAFLMQLNDFLGGNNHANDD